MTSNEPVDTLMARGRQRIVRGFDRVLHKVPPNLSATIDRHRRGLADEWGGPFNGQFIRQQLLRDLAATIKFDIVLETGTYRGATTQFLHYVTGAPTYSSELVPRFARYAQYRSAHLENVHVLEVDSRDLLSDKKGLIAKSTSFIYLDAHWQADTPRIEEVQIVLDAGGDAIIVIDDFRVAHDPGYGYATYDGRHLDFAYLPPLRDWKAFLPAIPAIHDTGKRRGYVVIVSPNLVSRVEGLDSLLAVELQAG